MKNKKKEQEDDNLGFSSMVRQLDEKWGHTYEDPAPGNDKAETTEEDVIESRT